MTGAGRMSIQRIIGEMRAEGQRYKSHPLGFVDSVSANRVDDWADELEAALVPLDPIDTGDHLAANGKPIDGYPRQEA